MRAMILAAGRGERLRPITDRNPKPLVEVGGISLIERHLRRLEDAGIATVVINLGWLGEQIVERLGSGAEFGLQIVYSPEYDHILDTGGGIRRALPVLGDDPFWVLNGDILTDIELGVPALAEDCDGHLVLVPTPAHKARGDFELLDGKVCIAAEPRYTFGGVACYRPAFFAAQPSGRFPLAPLLFDAAERGRLSGMLYEGRWADIGTPERLAEIDSDF